MQRKAGSKGDAIETRTFQAIHIVTHISKKFKIARDGLALLREANRAVYIETDGGKDDEENQE